MKGNSAIESVAIARGYANGTAMLLETHVDASTIDDNDPETWPAHKIDRTIKVHCLAGGSFRVEDGEKYNEGLTFDEMLGVIAALTMPENRPCLQWMQTKEQYAAREAHFRELRKQRQTTSQTNE